MMMDFLIRLFFKKHKEFKGIATRILAVISFMMLGSLSTFAQTENKSIERLTICHCGDSVVFTAKYELDVKRKKVYLKSLVANYLHVKGGKLRKRVKIDRRKKKEIFRIVDRLDLSALEKLDNSLTTHTYYAIEIFFDDSTSIVKSIQEDLLPLDFKKLYDTIIDKK